MKRFLLFLGEDYYPCRGWRDFYVASNKPGELKEIAKRCVDADEGELDMWYPLYGRRLTDICWAQIVDMDKEKIVWEWPMGGDM